MKRTLLILPMLAVVALAGILVAAQQEEPKPDMSLVIVEKVKPSMTAQYEQATKEMCELLTEFGADPNLVSYWTIQGPEFGYAYIVPLPEGFDSMNTTRANWMGAIESIGAERWKKLAKKADECVESRSMTHSVYREDLSYNPKNPAIKEQDIRFAHYDVLYAFPHKQEEFESIAKQWAALYEKKGIKHGWRVIEHITGEDLPAYMVIKVSTSEADFYTTREKIREQLGADAKALGEKSEALIRKYESMVGFPRPDLSFPMMTTEE